MKIVLDTNVLISGLINPNGTPAQVINLVLQKSVSLLLDTRIINEYSEVLMRPKFNFRKEWIHPLLDFIIMEGESNVPQPLNCEIPDPDDLKFLEVAISGKALYLVTGNTKHFPNDPVVVTPMEFIEIFKSEHL